MTIPPNIPPKRQIETQESLRLVAAFVRIGSDQARARVIALAEMLADSESPEEDSGSQEPQAGASGFN